ncbi:hypothetical protein DL98DRAFT_531419 [Cadophora sp. DSE1049]|nr:hypothetical protein DL98DRAFT_531419 [Cadophora sp. DSE1049]
MDDSVTPVSSDIDEFEAPDLDEPISFIEWYDLTSDEDFPNFVPLRPRPCRLTDSRPDVRNSLEVHIFEPPGPILSINHSGIGGKLSRRVSLAGQTCTSLRRLCSRLVGYRDRDVQIFYWNPLFRYWTEARASDGLNLMKMDVMDRGVVHVFVLRPWEKAVDLPFMRVDGFLLGEVVPVKGRREPCVVEPVESDAIRNFERNLERWRRAVRDFDSTAEDAANTSN